MYALKRLKFNTFYKTMAPHKAIKFIEQSNEMVLLQRNREKELGEKKQKRKRRKQNIF